MPSLHHLLLRPAAALAVLAAATVAVSLAGLLLAPAWLVPILDAAPAWLFMTAALRKGSRAGAVGLMLWWALWLALTAIGLTFLAPARAEPAILNGAAYRDEMFAWIATGVGRESMPSQFIPQHLIHSGLFCLLALLSAGALSLVMGAALMNYMSFYVGQLIQRCADAPERLTAMALAWNPWSMVRVISFVILGVVLSEPLLRRGSGSWPDPAGRRRWLLIAVSGLALDLVLKTALAPRWPGLLRGCLD